MTDYVITATISFMVEAENEKEAYDEGYNEITKYSRLDFVDVDELTVKEGE